MADEKKINDEILVGFATDNRIHWFKTIDGITYETNCGKKEKPICAGKETDLVCRDCYKAIIRWAERTKLRLDLPEGWNDPRQEPYDA